MQGINRDTEAGIFSFIGSARGSWKVQSMTTVTGRSLEYVSAIDVRAGELNLIEKSSAAWVITAALSHARYTTRKEKVELADSSLQTGNPDFDFAAMIPIKKSAEWWEMTQDERRRIFEEDSRHIRNGLAYAGIIARRLYHSKDRGEDFDFVTWFEFTSSHANAFDTLCELLRSSEEWKYVLREIDIRLVRDN
ncbi:MAG TPA: chlorite dismutase family protein [Ohtaekwangia sp.]|uniref:chlorite dismutase family protein n=1 Tax=Ohtaekwangia sp. TaxID=2066019 RepID=UPI002F954B79